MIYELRLYSVTHGRMPDVHSRFRDHLPSLFQRHGVTCVGAWSALAGPNAPRFVYLLAYRDYAHREEVWAKFYVDPEWARIRAETNAGHEMVERFDLFFLKPNASWSAVPASTEPRSENLYELVLQELAPGQNASTNEFLAATYLPVLHECGARTLGVFDLASGSGMQTIVMIHGWIDATAWHRGRKAVAASEALREAFRAQRDKLGHPFFGRTEVDLLESVSGMTVHPTLGKES